MGEATETPLPTYIIEGARSSRSRCKTCRRKIDKGVLRIGMLIEGPYGTGYLWHHLRCAARRRFEQVQEAYAAEAWKEAKEPPNKLPSIEELSKQVDELAERREKRREIPHTEVDPSGRAKCKHCGEALEKGQLRVVLGRDVEFGGQVRIGPVHVHPRCVGAELQEDHCATEVDGFAEALRANSTDIPADKLDEVLAAIGDLR
jgi:hypothetical protein